MNNTIKKLKCILSKKEQRSVYGLVVLMIIGGVLELIGVAGIFPIISYTTNGEDKSAAFIITLCVALIFVYIVKNLFLAFMYRAIFAFVYRGRSALATRLFSVYMNEPYSFHLGRNVAIIQRAVRNDVDSCYIVVRSLLQMLAEFIICIVLAGLLFVTDPVMAAFMAVLLITCVGVVVILSKNAVKKLGIKDMEYTTKMNQWILQGVGGIKEIRILNREPYFVDSFKEHCYKSSECNKKQQLFSLLPRMFTETVCIAGVMLWIVILTVRGENLIDTVPTLAVFAVSAFRLLPSVGKINTYLAEYHFYKPRVDFLYEDLMDINEEMTSQSRDDMIPFTFEHSIELENVSFRYANTDEDIFSDVNMKINEGESVGIVGPSGAGKTTLVDVIMGLLKAGSGDIKVDGKSIYENLRGWYSIIGYVPQSIYLADDTIRSNIAFGMDEEKIDDTKIEEVIRKAQLETFIKSLPNGLDTIVGDRGVRLSGGQRQRIGIARALYAEPKLLVLDEATSALDNDTEAAVMDAVDALHGEITMIIIAHRLTTIEKCDKIIRVDKGKSCFESLQYTMKKI